MKFFLTAPILLALVACGTPQQQCIAEASRSMNVLDRLIAETQGNIARGYAIQEFEVDRPILVDCTPDPSPTHPTPSRRTCFDDVPVSVSRPVAIDLGAEAVKLASMQKRRTEIARALQPAIADCQARHPE